MFLIATKIATYRDGGTIEVKYDNQHYFIDRRIGTATKNTVYDNYPSDRNAKIVSDTEIIEAVLKLLNN